MSRNEVASSTIAAGIDLVVVHSTGGCLTKGTLEWNPYSEWVIPPVPLPEELRIKCETSGKEEVIPLCETKAVFFVKKQEGNQEHDEVKFFSDVTPEYVWIRVEFADGELLEGQTENSCRLLFDPGLWLQPFDTTTNNVLVYIPKSSMIGFHIMGVTDSRRRKSGVN